MERAPVIVDNFWRRLLLGALNIKLSRAINRQLFRRIDRVQSDVNYGACDLYFTRLVLQRFRTVQRDYRLKLQLAL